jgi:glucosamine-6-phosphate deaminase
MNLPDFYTIPAEDLAAASPVPLTVLPDLDDLFTHFARAILDEIVENNRAGRPTRLILPVGPVGQYPILARLANEEGVSWRDVHVFTMDEYCDWQGRAIPVDHPLSFEGFIRRTLFEQLRPELRIPENQLHVPDPRHLDRASAEIERIGGIDTCYGGVGIHGHIAFNEPPISRWTTVSVDEFKQSLTRIVALAPETIVMNSSRAAAGNFAALPPMAVTLGMRDILGARRVRLYCQGGVWQRTVLRIALFGSEEVAYPVTLLRSHPDFAIVTDENTAQPAIPQMAA